MEIHFHRYTVEEIESKLFNGYVLDPIPIVMFPCFMIVVWSIFCIWITLDTVLKPFDHEILVSKSVIVSMRKNGDYIILENELGELYALNEDLINVNIFSDLIDYKEPLIIRYDARQAGFPRDVISVSRDDGVPIITKDIIQKYSIRENAKGLIFVWSFLCFQIVFFGFLTYILNNAKKYPLLASLIIRSTHRNF